MTPSHVHVVNDRFCAALAAGDASAAGNVYAADARLLAAGSEPIHGRAAIEAFWKNGIASGIAGATLETDHVIERDDVVVEIGEYRLRLDSPDGSGSDVGKYLVVHQRAADGEWQWAVDIFNTNGAAS
jgi:uncharacterized protein (TIGR02246 family)